MQSAELDHTPGWPSELPHEVGLGNGRIPVNTCQGFTVQLNNRLEERWIGSRVQHEEVDGSIASPEVVRRIVNQSLPHARPRPSGVAARGNAAETGTGKRTYLHESGRQGPA